MPARVILAVMADISAFVLAGGRSSRMGRDKAFLEWRGRTLLEQALELARTVTERVSIVGQREKFAAYAAVVEDVYPGQGPLAGIHAALISSSSELNLMLAVDTPLVTPEFLEYLVTQADIQSRSDDDEPGAAEGGRPYVFLPRVGGRLQPLCAAYRREFAEIAAQALQAGRNKIEPLLVSLPQRIIEEEELRRLAFDPRMFENLNTRAEWEKMQRS